MRMNSIRLFFLVLGVAIITGCNEDYTPKPRAYIRIALPEKDYQVVETQCPYKFEKASCADFVPDNRPESGPCWFDLDYPQFKAKIHFSYKPINNNLGEYLEDSRTLTNKHISKANNIEETLIVREGVNVYGMLYNIEGSQAASPVQFHLTDSTDHFLRGALYFNVTPNNDSLAPVIDFIKDDVLRFIETFEWKP